MSDFPKGEKVEIRVPRTGSRLCAIVVGEDDGTDWTEFSIPNHDLVVGDFVTLRPIGFSFGTVQPGQAIGAMVISVDGDTMIIEGSTIEDDPVTDGK